MVKLGVRLVHTHHCPTQAKVSAAACFFLRTAYGLERFHGCCITVSHAETKAMATRHKLATSSRDSYKPSKFWIVIHISLLQTNCICLTLDQYTYPNKKIYKSIPKFILILNEKHTIVQKMPKNAKSAKKKMQKTYSQIFFDRNNAH